MAAGATYILVPGVKLFASYLYGTRHQGGYDYLSGAAGPAYNNTQAQVLWAPGSTGDALNHLTALHKQSATPKGGGWCLAPAAPFS